MVSKVENRYAEKTGKKPLGQKQNYFNYLFTQLFYSRLESILLQSSDTMSQNLLRFHEASSHALYLTPLGVSWLFCLLISDPKDAERNSESYLEARESLTF